MNYEQLLKSKRKTCSRERLLRTLSAIADIGITHEGEGGKTAFYGDDYEVGTGLRAPDMPFYYKPRLSRQAVLKHLEDAGLITVKEHDHDEWTGIEITELGCEVLNTLNRCDDCKTYKHWYHTQSLVITGEKSGFTVHRRTQFCDCSKENFMDNQAKLRAGVLRASGQSSIGKWIEPKRRFPQ